jgi:hypothetical protein
LLLRNGIMEIAGAIVFLISHRFRLWQPHFGAGSGSTPANEASDFIIYQCSPRQGFLTSQGHCTLISKDRISGKPALAIRDGTFMAPPPGAAVLSRVAGLSGKREDER